MKDRKPKRLKEYRVKSDQSEGSQNDQNNNISSDSEDLNEDPLNLFYPNEDKIKLDNINNEEKKIFYKKIDVLYNIRKKSTINLIINYHRENIIKFGNITHKEGEIDYAQFKILYKGEKEKGQFEFVEYYILFEIFYKKLIGFLNKIRKITIQLFSRITLGNELLIKINLEEDGNNINADKNICNINSEYIFIYNSYKIKYQDKDILNGGDYKGFRLFSKEIIGYISNQTSIYYNFYYNNITDIIRDFNQIKKFNFKSFVKKVIINKGIAKKIRELDNGSFLCDGNNEIIQYNTYSKQFKKEYFKNYCSFFTDKNRVIIIPKNKIVFLNKPDGNYILFYENGIYYTSNNFNPISNDKICLRLSEMACRGGIKINDNFIAITSNRILSKGKNKLIFFNLISQKFMEEFEIENYSFTLSENNCSIIKFEKIIHNEGHKIYKQFSILFQGQFESFEYYILFKIFYKKYFVFLDKIKEIINQLFSGIGLRNKLLNKINQIADKDIKKINSENMLIDKSNKIQNKYNNTLNGGDYKSFKPLPKEIIGYTSNKTNIINISTKYSTNDSNKIKIYNNISISKIIGKHKKTAKKIMELDDGSFVSDGHNEINLYNKDLIKIKTVPFKKYYSFFIDNNKIIISLKNKLTYLNETNNKSFDNKEIYPCWNLFKLKDGNHLILYENGIYYVTNIFNPISNDKIYLRLSEMACRGGIKINDNFIAITSNRILSKGKNKLIFFNLISQKFMEEFEIENYSFTLSENNCSIMKIPKHENSKLLFAACKKYFKDDKNGILLVKLKINSNDIKTEYQKFYDTKNFEVYCFCPLFEIKNNNKINNIKKIEIEYFLVGGFDINKRQGLIKLYKVIYYDEIEKIEIEYIHDIIMVKKEGKNYLEFFKGFKGPINCIIQSSQGEILVTCNDGNIYSFYEIILEKEIEHISILKSCKGK